MDGLKQAVKRTALGLAEYVTPVLRSSKFRETGVITPDEFIIAGDFLVHHCPTWQWATGDKLPKDYLPVDKQYLLTRNVPCYKRIKQVDNHDEDYEKLVEDDGGEGWVDTHHFAIHADDNDKLTDLTMESTVRDNLRVATGADLVQGIDSVHIGASRGDECDDEDGDEEEAEDMEEFLQSGMLDELDPASVVKTTSIETVKAKNNTSSRVGHASHITGDQHDFIVQTRTYNLYITYDKYYQTPRLWLSGYDEHRRPLTEDQMFEDFSQDHVKRTVTMEHHPHISGFPMPSIHPCKQAEVMRKLIEIVADAGSGNQLAVHQYLMIFLKFVQADVKLQESGVAGQQTLALFPALLSSRRKMSNSSSDQTKRQSCDNGSRLPSTMTSKIKAPTDTSSVASTSRSAEVDRLKSDYPGARVGDNISLKLSEGSLTRGLLKQLSANKRNRKQVW